MRRKTTKRLAACLMVLILTATLFTGCGKDDTGVTDPGTQKPDDQSVIEEEREGVAMGRFVEKEMNLGDNSLTDWNSRLFRQSDGSFLLADNSGFVMETR